MVGGFSADDDNLSYVMVFVEFSRLKSVIFITVSQAIVRLTGRKSSSPLHLKGATSVFFGVLLYATEPYNRRKS